MTKIEEMALRVAEEIPIMFNHIDLDKDGHLVLTKEDIVTFSHTLLAELSKDAVPIAKVVKYVPLRKKGVISATAYCDPLHLFDERYNKLISETLCYEHPANISEIQNRVAEACISACRDSYKNGDMLLDAINDLDQDKWREYL